MGFGSLECEQREVMPALIPGRRVSVSIWYLCQYLVFVRPHTCTSSLRPHTLEAGAIASVFVLA